MRGSGEKTVYGSRGGNDQSKEKYMLTFLFYFLKKPFNTHFRFLRELIHDERYVLLDQHMEAFLIIDTFSISRFEKKPFKNFKILAKCNTLFTGKVSDKVRPLTALGDL